MRTPHTRAMFGALLLSASVAAISSPALAQDTATPQDTTEEADSGDIVVVAQGREQRLSDVPVAVSAVSAVALQNSGANDIRQLNQVAPSLLVSSTGSEANGSARIRGIGTVGDNPGLESSVAVIIDGVYRSRSGIGLNELGEIDRVEVLRGPQGTLGGRNASAGVISIFSKKPEFQFGGNFEATYGNYDFMRASGSITGPISETLAARLDGVYVRRDGFLNDARNGIDVNDRDRFFVRGQFLFEPSDSLSFRLIGDYTRRTESCCGAVYIDNSVNEYIGDLNNVATPLNSTTGNNIINVLRDLGQPVGAFNAGYSRDISVSAGRSYAGETTDGGISLEVNAEFGGFNLTSITSYRDYKSGPGGDVDYSAVDILYRTPSDDAFRQFQTFSQEIRLNGEAFGGKLDWLVGGYFANEDLTLQDNLRFGNQYGRFATCRLISGGGLAGLYSPTSAGCVASQPTFSGAFGAAGPALLASLLRLDGMNDVGTTTDRYEQNSRNWALFTHNIFHLTDSVDVTLGLRYTSERKTLDATFGNDNTVCTANQAALTPFLSVQSLAAVAGGIIGLSCQGNSTAELNGVSINNRRSEDEFSGTANLSWRPTDDLMVYASYSHGYKAGGFNLDRSALKSPIASFASVGGAQALVRNLEFDAETVDAYEIGAKYATGPFSLSVTGFRQDFSDFQLNTFNGTVFLVQNINGCGTDLNGADRDQNLNAAGSNFNAAAASTGACAASDVTYGVRSQGFELEAAIVPVRNFRIAMGLTYSDTSYRSNLVGNSNGAPLDPALRKLPGDNLSNAPELVTTGSLTWTPEIGSSGLTGLVYVDGRMTSDYNTGSDLFPQKEQDGYAIVNARLGVRGPGQSWSVELWAQNLFNKDYAQVGFNTPFQAGGTAAPFVDPQYPGGRQIFSMFLAEPRTYGLTVRTRF